MNDRLKNMILAALMLALCWLMPFITMLSPTIGSAISPMHIPVYLCGFVCGMPWAPIVGFIAPLLRSVTAGMPPLYPTAVGMAFELCAYGLVTALMNRLLPRRPLSVYAALIAAMLVGRAVWGTASVILHGLGATPFTFEMFLAGAFTNAVPGIICHIALIPPIVLALRRAKVIR